MIGYLGIDGLDGAFGFHHQNLLAGDGSRCGQNAFLLLTFDNQIKRVIAVEAVFFAGIAGGTPGQNPGVLAVVDVGLFAAGFMTARKDLNVD